MVNYKRKNNNSNWLIEPFPKRLKYSNDKILKKKNDYIDTNKIKKNKIIEEKIIQDNYINPYYLDYF